MKALKVTISGSYHLANKDIRDFEKVTGIIPHCDEDVATMHVMRRYAPIWISADKEKYPDRIHGMREVHIDKIEEVKDHKFSFIGKDIREMDAEELQDLATAKDLRKIPLWKVGGIREARTRAYTSYSTEILGKFIDEKAAGFNVMHQKPIVVKDGGPRRNVSRKITNEEFLEAEAANVSIKRGEIKSSLTLAELKQLADDKGIEHPPKITYDALYRMLFTD